MATEILMPALSPTMEEGKLAKWLVKEGQAIKAGDVIAEIETDKATMEVEAVDEGTVGRLLIEAGTDKVKVNTPIALLLGEGEKASDAPAAAPKAKEQDGKAAAAATPKPQAATARQPEPAARQAAAPTASQAASTALPNGHGEARIFPTHADAPLRIIRARP